MSGITTHVLDTSRGRPAAGVLVSLEFRNADNSWRPVGEGKTDSDGRVKSLAASLVPGTYRLTFSPETYFRERDIETFFPQIVIVFEVRDALQHYHVPLLLSPFGYSTYRGS